MKTTLQHLNHLVTKAKFISSARIRHWTTQVRMHVYDMGAMTKKRVGIVTLYQPSGIAKDTKSFLRTLSEQCGFDVVVVSHADVSDRDLHDLAGYCPKVIVRTNHGFEMGALKAILPHVRPHLRRAEELLLTNDSVIGPVRSLGPMFSEMAGRTCDFWAIESCERGIHARSNYLIGYFLVLRRSLLATGTFERFVRSCRTPIHRRQAITYHEKGLTRYFTRRGFTPDVFITANTIREACARYRDNLPGLLEFIIRDPQVHTRARRAFLDANSSPAVSQSEEEALYKNAVEFIVADRPTAFLLLECGLPFVKKDLLKRGLATANELRCVIQQITGDSELAMSAERVLTSKAEAAKANPYLCSRGYL